MPNSGIIFEKSCYLVALKKPRKKVEKKSLSYCYCFWSKAQTITITERFFLNFFSRLLQCYQIRTFFQKLFPNLAFLEKSWCKKGYNSQIQGTWDEKNKSKLGGLHSLKNATESEIHLKSCSKFVLFVPITMAKPSQNARAESAVLRCDKGLGRLLNI